MARKVTARSRQLKMVEPEPKFIPVHAESMSTPIFAQLSEELGEPDLNLHECTFEGLGVKELIKLHKPDLSLKKFAPAWAQDTGAYFTGRAAIEQFRSKMKQDEVDKETFDGQYANLVSQGS